MEKNNVEDWSIGQCPGGIYYEHKNGFRIVFDMYEYTTKDEMFEKAKQKYKQSIERKK